MSIIDKLHWRYAVKEFDAAKKVSPTDLATILEAIRLSASSYGQQPYKVFLVENPSLRETLVAYSRQQEKIATASHLLVFAIDTNLGEQSIASFIEKAAIAREVTEESLGYYYDLVLSMYNSKTPEQLQQWAARQIYIALGQALTVCAEIGVDSCAIEGFEPEKYDEVLGLKEKGYKTVLALVLGYRASSDGYQHYKKTRKSTQELIEII